MREAVQQLAPVRVLIVDGLQSWRRCVSAILEEHREFQIVGEASDGLEAVHQTEELQPDLILLDIVLPHFNGIEAARRICAIAPDSTILFISENQCQMVAEEAMRASPHTRGYVVKSDACSDLLPALEAVVEARHFISRGLRAFATDCFPVA